ncbi:hypothetical protein ACOMHN_014194 [Nucella lapillus]
MEYHGISILLLLLLSASSISGKTADIEVRMNEERAVGSFVVNVSEYPTLFLEVSVDDRSRLTFHILDKDSFDASFFSINSTSGAISVAKRLDREVACSGQVDCHVEFNVAIQGPQFSNIASIKVFIDDINDNAPTFPAEQVVLDISEAAKVGYVLKLTGPQDIDSPPNNTIQRYELTLPAPHVFSVSPTQNPDGSTVLSLKLERELDRETTPKYDFSIIAYDGGVPPKSDFLRVIVQVTDDNDNAPVFEAKSYTVNVREDASPGAEVVQVRARDKDAGEFGKVNYRFSSLASQGGNSLFQLNSTSGSITLKSSLEHSPTGDSPYSLVVEAFDGGNPPSVAQAVVTIHVLNTGNNAPIVRIVTVSEGDTSQIFLPESAKVNDFVAFVNVEDRDEGNNGEVRCSFVNSSQFRLKTLPNKGYQVLLASSVDRERVPSYDAAILCQDRGSPPLSTEATFTVVITDVNDNDPSFDQQTFTATVLENNAEGQYLLHVTATDRDSGPNARLTYGFLEPEAVNYVTIHAQTGVVRARVTLDREVTPVLTFTLTAVDGGEKARTGTVGLTIKVLDVNDNSPQLLHTPYHFEVSEGALSGHVIANMMAIDVDEGDNGQVEFFFAGSVSGEVPFSVLPNGTVAVSGVLDRETSESHTFTVLARDKGNIPRSNSTQVMIRVTDINDNAPVILFPTSVNHSVVITSLPEQGITLGRVIAYDVDEGNASSLLYIITSGDAQGVFDIDPEKGEIFLADLKRLKNPFTYQVVLRVYDRGPMPLFAETSLQIEVNFPNVTFPGGLPGSGGNNGDDESDPPRDSYVIIVGVIGGATLVLSGIIIGAILFVLRSEKRKPRGDSGMPVYKNDYVPAPTGIGIGIHSEKLECGIPKSPEMRSSHSDVSASGVVLSPNSLPQKGAEGQKKVSFSFEDPDPEGRQQLHSQEMLLVPLPHPSHHEDPHEAWKRVASPDDLNSDTSGDSGTCDSGRGASDDDIHLDNSGERHGAKHGAPPPTNTNRTPARHTPQSNLYTPATFTLGTFRPLQEEDGDDDDDNPDGETYATGPYLTGERPRPGSTAPHAPNPNFFLQGGGGSFHEGRHDNSYPRSAGGGKFRPRRPADHPPHPHHQHPHHHPHHPHQTGPVVSLHPEAKSSSFWQGQGGGSRRSLDLVENRRGGGGGGPWVPPRSSSSLSYERQNSGGMGGMSMEDDASTTTSGSYTLNPEDLRLDGHGLNTDVIV